MKKISLFILFMVFLPLCLIAQDAEDIIVPEDYKVEKIAVTNRAMDVEGITFDSSGNLIAGSLYYMIYKVDQNGNVETITKTRRYNFAPIDVEISPDGTYIVLCQVGIDVGGLKIICKFTPPDYFEPLIDAYNISAIAYDRLGNFYASLRDTNSSPWRVVRYDSNFDEVDTVSTAMYSLFQDIAFDSNNNMYLTEPNRVGFNEGMIWKIPPGDNGIPGSEDPQDILNFGTRYPMRMTVDNLDNLFITTWSHQEIDGFSSYNKHKLIMVDSSNGNILEEIADDLANVLGLAYKDGFIYLSEFTRGVISRIDLSTNTKENFTVDNGISSAGPVNFDSNDNLYTHSFRELRLLRLNESGTFDQVGNGTGYAQSIATDGTHFYMGSSDLVGENGYQVLKINPIGETMEVVGTQLGGWRSVTFDSYGRLILNTIIDVPQNHYGADIIDLETGVATPYLIGLHNKARCIQFDGRQNLYVVEGIGDGLKKVWLEENYDPPRDISGEPLFYDFRTEPYPPTIYFFHVNHLEEVFIPLMEQGAILMGDKFGNVEVFAQGFLAPSHVTFDKYGSMYVSDGGNGLFKISHKRWTIPAIIALKDKLIQEIKDSGIHAGVKSSLIMKLENADMALEQQNITSAIMMILAFKNDVMALRGKKIPVEMADRWIGIAENLIEALNEVNDAG